MGTRVQIMDKAVCILHSPSNLWKGVNPTILLRVMGTYLPTPSLGQDMTQGQFLCRV